MNRICLFPVTFDPVTLGHTDIYVGIGMNASKAPMFSTEQRIAWFREIYKDEPKIEAGAYTGLTVDYCKILGAGFILRGIRFVSDFEYEKTIADANRMLDKNIETIFLTGESQYSSVASTIVRDILKHHGDASPFLPEAVIRTISKQ